MLGLLLVTASFEIGELPTDPGFGQPMGPPPEFVGFGILAVLAGIGTTLWRVSLARRVARDAGMDPGRATEITLLEDHGLEASYLAGHLQPRVPLAQRSGSAGDHGQGADERTVEQRLRELRSLLDQGLVTQQEHDTRRQAILDSI